MRSPALMMTQGLFLFHKVDSRLGNRFVVQGQLYSLKTGGFAGERSA